MRGRKEGEVRVRPVVMSDVAREAGVSQQTVSRVLHDHPSVRPETRARVNAAIERLGYRPNLAARLLAAGRSRTVGVLLTSQLSHGTAAIFAAIADSARQEGYQLVVVSARDDSSVSVAMALDELAGYRVEVSIILARRIAALDELGAKPASRPRILVAGQGGIAGVTTVAIDQTSGAIAATEHLLRTGRRRLVHVAGDLSNVDAVARRDAFVRTCADAGVTLISPFVGRILDWYRAHEGRDFTVEEDPGVLSVRRIYTYYKRFGYPCEVMGASFRSTAQILALAGCDLLTISPALLAELDAQEVPVARKLDPDAARQAQIERLSLDEPAFRFDLNEDAMATEKLAEGIRAFVADARTLDGLLARKV